MEKNEIGKGWKMRNVRGKRNEKAEDFFFFFCFGFSLSGSHWNFFGVYQNGNFYRENAKIRPGKNQEKWLCHPPLKNLPVTPLNPSQQNGACRLQKNYDIPFIWKSILSAQRWYLSCVNWMQHCNFTVKNRNFSFFFLLHTVMDYSWNAYNQQVPCFDVMGHIMFGKPNCTQRGL